MENTHMARPRSSSFVTTVDIDDPGLPSILSNIRKSVKLWNAERRLYELEDPKFVTYSWSGKMEVRRRAKIRVRGRLGKDNPNAPLYRLGGPLHRYYRNIRVEHSTRVDIYVTETHSYVAVK